MVVINSPDIAYELLEKRSSIYSDRADLPMVKELCVCLLLVNHVDPDRCRMGWDWLTTFIHYGEQWRRHRRTINQKFHAHGVTEYQPVQLKHSRFTVHLNFQP